VLLVVTAAALAASYLALPVIVESRAGRVYVRSAMPRAGPVFLVPVESFSCGSSRFRRRRRYRRPLYVPQVGIINPGDCADHSIEASSGWQWEAGARSMARLPAQCW